MAWEMPPIKRLVANLEYESWSMIFMTQWNDFPKLRK